jgi:hypothetical protein
MNGIAGLRWQRFPKETLRRLFDAVDTDDVVDAHVDLPDPIVLACPDEWIERCYALCLQFWEDGVTRAELMHLVEKLLRNEGLSADDRIQYKNIRARYKHLRFAQRLYGKRHHSGFVFDLTTRVMGHLQDAFRGGQRGGVIRRGLELKLLLSRPIWRMVRRGLINMELDNEAGFVAHQRAEIGRLKKTLGRTMFAGHQFHTVRKIISMQVSYYDTLRSFGPNEHAFRMSRFLAAINGLMGARHDEMVADELSGRRDYRTPTPLATQTRTRLETLISHYPL